jgi:hypothetical protein
VSYQIDDTEPAPWLSRLLAGWREDYTGLSWGAVTRGGLMVFVSNDLVTRVVS